MLRHPRPVALAISNRRVIWLRLCGAIAIAGLIFASLLLPAEWERLRTGHWLMEHFLAYFVASLVICLGWPRPFVVAGALAVAAAILETLQGLTPNHPASVDFGNGGSRRSTNCGADCQVNNGGMEPAASLAASTSTPCGRG